MAQYWFSASRWNQAGLVGTPLELTSGLMWLSAAEKQLPSTDVPAEVGFARRRFGRDFA